MQTALAAAPVPGSGSVRGWLADTLPKAVLAPTLLVSLIFVYGFIAWTVYLSLTPSRLLPNYEFVGLAQYIALFDNERWWVALKNLAIFGFLFVFLGLAIGLTLAILLDQRIRIEGFLRSLYLYPMALSFIVTGAAWKWILNPSLGLEHLMRSWGFESFSFDWLVNPAVLLGTAETSGSWVDTDNITQVTSTTAGPVLTTDRLRGVLPYELDERALVPVLDLQLRASVRVAGPLRLGAGLFSSSWFHVPMAPALSVPGNWTDVEGTGWRAQPRDLTFFAYSVFAGVSF